MKIEKSLLSGNTPMLILALLKDGDKYGYEMVEELARRSDNTFELKEGTLYPLLHTLEKNKYVKSYTMQTPGGRERKYYHLTEDGRTQLEYKTKEWHVFSEKVNAVLGCTAPSVV
ncbi:MAG: helix-turn-helix transcriptional regulator [Lachnospiraceae bacterium]|nr:helix-turn-helix transcriptional regulator [Lachnospiraceae bacterium]